jgi:cellulose biosynthesis protein BcsQ
MEKYIENIHFENFTNVKIDVGTNYSAHHSQMWLEHDEEIQNTLVIGFEPNPESVQAILKGNIKNKFPNRVEPTLENKYINKNFFIIPVALNDVKCPTEMKFYITAVAPDCCSLYKPIDPNISKIKDCINVPVFSFKHFFDVFPWNNFDKIDYVKIDAQGADFNIIKSMGDYVDRVVYITAEPETNQYENITNNTLENMSIYLSGRDFTHIQHPNTKDPTFLNKRYLDIADKIFIKQCW